MVHRNIRVSDMSIKEIVRWLRRTKGEAFVKKYKPVKKRNKRGVRTVVYKLRKPSSRKPVRRRRRSYRFGGTAKCLPYFETLAATNTAANWWAPQYNGKPAIQGTCNCSY